MHVNFVFERYTGKVAFVPGMNRLKGRYVVCAYEQIKPTCQPSGERLTAPNVEVILKRIAEDNTLVGSHIFEVKITFLPLLKIGTVVEDGKCVGYSKNLMSLKTEFDQSSGTWRHATKDDYFDGFKENYPLRMQDKSYYIEFLSIDGYKVLIPCLVYFSACYGVSAELKRILVTYPWDEVCRRICGPISGHDSSQQIVINLPKKLVDDDATFIAHALYDKVARNAAKYLYSQIEINHDKGKKAPIFLRVLPWFSGSMQVELRGIWISQNVFLGLSFEGISEPDGDNILYGRANRSPLGKRNDKPANAWKNALVPKVNLPLVVLHSDYDPAPEEPPIEVIEPRLKIIGHRRSREKIDMGEPNSSSGGKSDKTSSNSATSGNNNPGSPPISPINQKPNLESVAGGTLLGMWTASQILHQRHPQIIRSVRYYLMNNSYGQEVEPLLISLEPYSEDEKTKLSEEEQRWIYSSYSQRKIRGILVIKYDLPEKSYVIVELERKHGAAAREEHIKGLIFEKSDQFSFDDTINQLKKRLRDQVGNINKCIGLFKNASTFNHPSSKTHDMKCQKSIVNAFKKIGVDQEVIITLKSGLS
ncbi:hypothetical protein [Rheinheimera fenheensis]|uniref:hypothetical protein n=1 Tax=Rheinheimera fenheensis TaxID=3152295 RepID=UPI00325EE8D7